LGKSKRTPDREAVKPYLFVHAKAGKWEVLHTPSL
jgi:branched-chain amino acid transport system substrate-binding protein